jgi:hypothetical protein
MRRLFLMAGLVAGLYALVSWWRDNRRVGTGFVNRIVNPWLERRGIIGATRDELALVEHVGRTSGIVRRTPIHPIATPEGYRIIVPVGESSQWARNVLAAGHCRLILSDRVVELDEPILRAPADVPGLPLPTRALFGWLGFRYLELHAFGEVPVASVEEYTAEPMPAEAVPA